MTVITALFPFAGGTVAGTARGALDVVLLDLLVDELDFAALVEDFAEDSAADFDTDVDGDELDEADELDDADLDVADVAEGVGVGSSACAATGTRPKTAVTAAASTTVLRRTWARRGGRACLPDRRLTGVPLSKCAGPANRSTGKGDESTL
ncbi:MAG TPA: hypothetical protein VFU35_01720 [Jatrophihabitans sp.]|nr:hypothetical protein [Jatrophihabitans sp.]